MVDKKKYNSVIIFEYFVHGFSACPLKIKSKKMYKASKIALKCGDYRISLIIILHFYGF